MTTPFSKENIVLKQQKAREEYEQKAKELRLAVNRIASTEDGEHFLRYLFLMTGGNAPLVRRDKDNKIDLSSTMLGLGVKSVWDTLRLSISSDLLKIIERQNWEE